MDALIKTLFKIFSIVILALSICHTPSWAVETITKGNIKVKGKLPAGVVIKKNKVSLKSGYVFEKVSKSRVNVIARDNGGITGSFDCTCNGNDGGCDVITTPTSVSCAVSTCKSSCYMITTIPGSNATGYLRWIK